jgi:hypothetical protein
VRRHSWRTVNDIWDIWESQKCIRCGLSRDRFNVNVDKGWIYFVPGEGSDAVRIIHEYESPPDCLEIVMRTALR